MQRSLAPLAVAVLSATLLSGCSTLREVANLRSVRFSIDALSGLEVAGIDVMRVRSYEDLDATDVVRIGASVARNELPVHFTLDVRADNPAENSVQARMVRFDWTLLLEDRETISGVFEDEVVIPSGDSRVFPVGVRLDLIEFFDRNARDLVELVLSLAGQDGAARNVKLRATPTVRTIVGDIRYPEPITVVSATVGG